MMPRPPPPIPEEHERRRGPPPRPPPSDPEPPFANVVRAPPTISDTGIRASAPTPPPSNSGTRPPPPNPYDQDNGGVRASPPQSNLSGARAPPPIPYGSNIGARAAPPNPRLLDETDSLPFADSFDGTTTQLNYSNTILAKMRKIQKNDHAVQRALICAIAILLLWLTSFAFAEAVVDAFIQPPCQGAVLNSIQSSLNFTNGYRESYNECANRLVKECNQSVIEEQNIELARVLNLQIQNRILLDLLYYARDQCSMELSNGIATLSYIQSHTSATNVQTAYPTAITSTDQRCPLVAGIIKGGGAGSIEALGTTSQYSVSANTQVSANLNALQQLQQYDASYYANKQTELEIYANTTLPGLLVNPDVYFSQLNGSFNLYLACIAQSGTYGDQTCPSESVLAQAAAIQTIATNEYVSMKTQALAWETQATNTINTANNFYTNLKNNAALQAAINVLLGFDGLPSLSDMGFNDIPTLTFPTLGFTNFPNIDIDQIFANYEAQATAYTQSVVQQQQLAIQEQAQLEEAQLQLGVTNALPNYQLSSVNISAEELSFQAQSNAYVNQMATTVQGSVATGDVTNAIYQSDTSSLTLEDDSSTLISAIPPRSFELVEYPGLTIQVFNIFSDFRNYPLYFDIAYRIFKTIQTIVKYWKLSRIYTPPSDVRSDDMYETALHAGGEDSFQSIGNFVTGPYALCFIVTVISLVMAVAFVGIYYPFYNEYYHGCVLVDSNNETQLINATMLSENAYRISYSYVSSEGSTSSTVGIDRINSQRYVTCNSQVDLSRKVLDDNQNEWDFIYNGHQDLQYQALALAACVDIPVAQTSNPTAAAIATNNNITNLETALPGSFCNFTFPPLYNAIYNCSDESCPDPNCDFPAEIKSLRLENWKASCYTEWSFHANFFGTIMIFIVYFLINVSRVLVLNGLTRVFWRYLSDRHFTYVATCNEHGDVELPTHAVNQYMIDRNIDAEQLARERKMDMETDVLRIAIKQDLGPRIQLWMGKSCFLFVSGLYLNLVWIITLFFISQTIANGSFNEGLASQGSC